MYVTRIAWAMALAIAALVLAACGAASSPSPAASAAASPATSSPSPSVAEASASAPASPPAEATESPAASDGGASPEPSGPLPGFSFPSEAAELEAVLPDEACGQQLQKLSFSGDSFEQFADDEMTDVLDRLGRSPQDVSMAIAAGTTGDACGVGIVRIQGASTDQIEEVFLQASEEQGDTIEQQSIAGRDVFVVTSDGETQYIYFVGDAFVFVNAPEGEVEGLLNELP